MSTMEWVYTAPPDSPTLFEGDAHANSLPKPQPFDLFAPFQPVEPTFDSEQEPEYYGTSDPDEETLTPEAAFLKFAGTVYAPVEIVPVSSVPAVLHPLPTSRQERIARIAAELSALEQEKGEFVENDPIENISALRRQLSAVEKSLNAKKVSLPTPDLSNADKDCVGNVRTDEKSNKSAVFCFSSPDIAVITTLERRVAALEKIVGSAHDETCDGVNLASLISDAKMRLDLLEDPGIMERLKQDAKDIAEVLRREVQSDAGRQALQTAEVLRKMEQWEDIAETVPIVVERLRCLKRVQDEAAGFVGAMQRIGETVDALSKRRGANEALIANVERSLRENLQTVQRNFDLLQDKLEHEP